MAGRAPRRRRDRLESEFDAMDLEDSSTSLSGTIACSSYEMCRNDDAVALLDHADAISNPLDDHERLVTDDETCLGTGAPVEHVQVGSADRARGHLENDVGGILNRRVLDLVDADAPGVLVDDGFHAREVRARAAGTELEALEVAGSR
jgi:hypothetical protein